MPTTMGSGQRFPWDLVVGIPATGIALWCILFVVAFTGPQFDIMIVNEHQVGGTFDKLVATALATLFGGMGILALRAFHRRISRPSQVDKRVLGDRL